MIDDDDGDDEDVFMLALALAAKLLFGGGIVILHGRRFIALEPWPLAPLVEVPSLIISHHHWVVTHLRNDTSSIYKTMK